MIAGTLAALLFIEIALRIWGPPYYRFNNSSGEYYTNPRGYHEPLRKEGGRTIYGLRAYCDNFGYRLPDNMPELHEQGTPPPADFTRENVILGLGDSFTFGRGVRYNDIYLTLLEKELDRNGYPAYIKNAARPGDDLEQIVKIHYYETWKAEYDVVIVRVLNRDFVFPVALANELNQEVSVKISLLGNKEVVVAACQCYPEKLFDCSGHFQKII